MKEVVVARILDWLVCIPKVLSLSGASSWLALEEEDPPGSASQQRSKHQNIENRKKCFMWSPFPFLTATETPLRHREWQQRGHSLCP